MDRFHRQRRADRADQAVCGRDPVYRRNPKDQPVLRIYLIGLVILVLAVLPAFASAQPHVAESTVQPSRLIQSQGRVHYNYNVHRVEEVRENERVTMYRYNVLVFDQKPTKEEIEKALDVTVLDSKDMVDPDAKSAAPVCDETKVPDWVHPEKVEKLDELADEPIFEEK